MKFFLFRCLLTITNALPLSMVHRLGAMVGYVAWRKHGEIRSVIETNIRTCFPEVDAKEQAELVRRNLSESGKLILESGKMWCGDADECLSLIQAVEGEHFIEEAQRQQRGIILALPHCGCWEIVGLYFARHYATTTMYADRRGERLEQLVRDARQRTGATLVPADKSGVRAMSRALRRQELVAIMPDQSPVGRGQFAKFFGQTCYTMTLLPRLARGSNALVLFAYARRQADSSGFRIFVRPSSEDIARLEVTAGVQTVNDDTETVVREAPEQYWWAYKRFKKQPGGAAAVYS